MCLDGLSAYCEITRDDRVKIAINRLIDGLMRLDIGIPTFIGQENVGAKLKVCDAKPKTDLSV